MKNLQKGFIAPLLVVIALVIIGGAYFIYSKNTYQSSNVNSSQPVNTDTSSNNSVPFVNSELITISGPFWNNEKTQIGFVVTKETAKEYQGYFYELQKNESSLTVFSYPSFGQISSVAINSSVYSTKTNLDCQAQVCSYARGQIFLWEGNKLALKLVDVDYINKRNSPSYFVADIGSKSVQPVQLSVDWQITEGIPFSAQSGATYFNADKLIEAVKNNTQLPHKIAFKANTGEVLSDNKIVDTTVKKIIKYNAKYADSSYKQIVIPESVIEKLIK
ncbi:MAG: hypothetical protein HYT38_00620 [Candidatus Sungbacteria bacterium]|uniref:Uncharacterized protein n=1 Tax=Candidatus Sungiibacteriota bacterium TaxID=2750080 RepID=A0A931YD88_9BACT|nr:hypothetical protein [Candidatus Sungbacteria bacterium]MBI2465800.1 hypothetical protein [Candidatus Sungbacteria bacterium]